MVRGKWMLWVGWIVVFIVLVLVMFFGVGCVFVVY